MAAAAAAAAKLMERMLAISRSRHRSVMGRVSHTGFPLWSGAGQPFQCYRLDTYETYDAALVKSPVGV
jgi:hypothetical protein